MHKLVQQHQLHSFVVAWHQEITHICSSYNANYLFILPDRTYIIRANSHLNHVRHTTSICPFYKMYDINHVLLYLYYKLTHSRYFVCIPCLRTFITLKNICTCLLPLYLSLFRCYIL